MLNSSYYAQTNGQDDSSNNTFIKLIKQKIDSNPRRWHELLSEALWAHNISRHDATKLTPFELVYGPRCHVSHRNELETYRIAKKK